MFSSLEETHTPRELTDADQDNIFQHFFRRLAAHRNAAKLYALAEHRLSTLPDDRKSKRKEAFEAELNRWAQDLASKAWIVCSEPGGGTCPELDEYADTSIGDLPELPPGRTLSQVINTILFLHITSSKQYSARTRAFLSTSFGTHSVFDEEVIVSTLKNPNRALEEAQKKAEATTRNHASNRKLLRMVGIGASAVAGGVLVGVTGGLAAPLIGAGMTTILGWLGVGGTAAGLLASGLAGSSAICGALFGVYGAQSSANMVLRHTRDIRDLAIVPVSEMKGKDETLAVRLCVSGWLTSPEDVTAPWSVFDGDDTFALQWEVKALEELSDALFALVKDHAMKYVRAEVIRRTVFASLLTSLAPIALLKIGQIIDNPWMNAKALAIKAGAVLGELLAERVFGNRPVSLVGYSLGSLVIFEALKHLASLPPSDTIHLIQDVFLFGTPVSTDPGVWAGIRRLVNGRLVNGYSNTDYVLAVLSRVSDVSWKVAGLHPVEVQGVENLLFEGVDGHTKWRGMIGKCLREAGAPGILEDEVEFQIQSVASPLDADDAMSPEEADEVLAKGL